MNILKPKMAKNDKMQVLGPKFSKLTAPNFWPNSLCGANTVFKESCQTKGGAPQDPEEAANCRTNSLLKLQMDIWNLKIGHLEVPIGHFETQNGHLEQKIGHLEAQK